MSSRWMGSLIQSTYAELLALVAPPIPTLVDQLVLQIPPVLRLTPRSGLRVEVAETDLRRESVVVGNLASVSRPSSA